MQLSKGAILEILNGATPNKPVFQIVSAKKMESASSAERYRILLSDSEHLYSHVMLTVQLNKLMTNNDITINSVVEVTKYMCNQVQGEKRILVLSDLNVLAKGNLKVGGRIGNPVQLNPAQLSAVAAGVPSSHSDQAAVKQTSTNQGGLNNNAFKANESRTTPSTPSRVHEIATLTPYQNRWRIRARVTMKSNIRNWSNSRGDGRLFNVNLLDSSGEIRLTGFNSEVDKYYSLLEVNKVYYISKCTLKTADKRYSTLNCDYEMTMTPETIIEPCNDDDVDLPMMTFDFVKISDLEKCKNGSSADVIGVVKVANDVGTVIGKQSQKEITKRDLQIVDQSGVAVKLTLWGDDAVNFNGQGYPVVAVKGAKVSDFGGRSLSVSGGSQMLINPDLKEAHILRGWFENEGRDQTFNMFQSDGSMGSGQSTNWKNFLQVKTENLGQGEKADYFTAKATIIFVRKENCMYQACPTADCNKKVVDQGNGLYRCEKCNREFPNYKWRMILSVNLADHTDNQWVTCFQESAESMLGIKADELGALRETDEVQFEKVINDAQFKQYVFRLRAKVETYNDENRLKTVCVGATPVDWKETGYRLIEQLSQMGI
ncbi:unnamed protein product [Candidula unifasciata]|uniref:Replication protein A subunit n=1 Tax=Candidula unifasciata TaxID=100452 RepID=A0A8S3ZJ67_9EUPU|nr:unnamed protein product [Candidula unifasciata]